MTDAPHGGFMRRDDYMRQVHKRVDYTGKRWQKAGLLVVRYVGKTPYVDITATEAHWRRRGPPAALAAQGAAMSSPAFVEVFGDDGELFPVPTEEASDEVLEDELEVLLKRRAAIERDNRGLRELLARRRGEPVERSAEEVRQEGRRQAVAGRLRHFGRRP